MTSKLRRERGTEVAAHSGETPLTADEQQVTEALATGLGSLRTARPGFQDSLERRLLDRLAEPTRPWWAWLLPARSRARRPRPGGLRLPRRSFIGLAAASAVALVGASLSLPLTDTPGVSAREILERVQATSENPGLTGVTSFHLTAKVWNDPSRMGKPEGQRHDPVEVVTEQWFVAPDKLRTESRARDANGKLVVSGMMSNGSEFKHYVTEGASDALMITVFTAPIGAKPVGDLPVEPDVRQEQIMPAAAPGATGTAGAPAAGARGAPPQEAGAGDMGFVTSWGTGKKPGSSGERTGADRDILVVPKGCDEPKRTGEATIAGRPVFVVESDFSTCFPDDAPAILKGRHVRWVDQKTYLPLKMEMYDQGGALADRYEVTSIEYDVEIPLRTFTELPPGTKERDVPKLPPFSAREH